MRAGRLDQLIKIEQATIEPDEFGQEIETWTTLKTVWAAVEPTGGKETFTADQLQSELVTRFILRYLPGVDTKMRINYGQVIYDIQDVINTRMENKELIIMAVKRGR